jgi:integrase
MHRQRNPDPRARVKTNDPGIYKRGSRYQVPWRDSEGTQHWKSCKTKAEARAFKAKVTLANETGGMQAPQRLTLDEYAEQWIDSYRGRDGRGVATRTLSNYKARLRLHIKPYFGKQQVVAIKPRHVREFVNHLEGKGLSPTGVRPVIVALKALLATAVEDGLILASPAAHLRLSLASDNPADKPKALEEAHLAALIAAAYPEWTLMMETAVDTGLRIGELRAVRWLDFNFADNNLAVARAFGEADEVTQPKHGSYRTINVPPDLMRELWQHRATTPFHEAEDYIFTDKLGQPRTYDSASRQMLTVSRHSGIEATWHTLRHTCASRMFRAGCSIKQVQEHLGHKDPAFTLRTYIHMLPSDRPDLSFMDGLRRERAKARLQVV